jgi:hypothetical protein
MLHLGIFASTILPRSKEVAGCLVCLFLAYGVVHDGSPCSSRYATAAFCLLRSSSCVAFGAILSIAVEIDQVYTRVQRVRHVCATSTYASTLEGRGSQPGAAVLPLLLQF